MCYGMYAVGVIQDRRLTIKAVGGTATHELGHILGMSHDEMNGSRSFLVDSARDTVPAALL